MLPSVSHCSTVMLYAVFNFLSLVYCPVQNGKDLNLWSVEVKEQNWGECVYNQTGHFSFTPQIATCAFLTSVIANVPISAISTIMLSFIHLYNFNHIHTQPTITVDTTPYSQKRCLRPFTFCNYKCINIGFFQISAVLYTLKCYP